MLVQPGTYYENINFNGHNIVLGSLFLTTEDTSYITLTIIDGSSSPTTDGHIQFNSGEDRSAVITGFTVRNPSPASAGNIYCNNSSPTISYNIIRDAYIFAPGGGISCRNYANPLITKNTIIDNWSTEVDGGGGICCAHNSSPIIMDNIISGNMAEAGGGIYCHGNSNAVIFSNKIDGNSAGFYGGGIFCVTSNAIISGNEITNNRSHYHGGGIYCGGPIQMVISNNIITGNVASDNDGYGKGGGIYCQATNPILRNNICYANSADSIGGGLFCRASNPLITNGIFRADSIGWPLPAEAEEIYADSSWPVVEYCNIQGGWPGAGNIDIDPFFRNPADGDFHLMVTYCGDSLDSPCIDAGSPYYSDSLLDCSWGLGTTTGDMGAYGGGDTALVNIYESTILAPERFMILRAYPNPFNARTTVEFTLAVPGDVELTIYDITGAEVKTVKQSGLEAGRHAIVWEAKEAASGVYFARMEAGGFSKSTKMVLLK